MEKKLTKKNKHYARIMEKMKAIEQTSVDRGKEVEKRRKKEKVKE